MIDVRAADGGYVDDAVEVLGGSTVFVSPEVSGHAELAARLETQVGDASIGVAVFSDNAALEASGPDIVDELAQRTDFDTIIVAVGDDLSAGSDVLRPAGEAMRIANESEGSAGSVEAALTQTVQQVIAELPSAETPSAPSGVAITGGVVAVVVVAAAVTTIVALGRRRSRRARAQAGAPQGAGELPAAVQASLQTLRSVRDGYASVATGDAGGAAAAAETVRDIDVLVENVPELFGRLDRKGGEAQRTLAEVEYGDKLAKLTAALDRDYLLDILTHPHLWDDPDERIREVREASAAVSGELIDNIRQVNARRALHFQVSLDSLIRGRKELRDWEREFRAVDDGKQGDEP